MNFFARRKAKKTLRKFREGVALLRHADDDILSESQKQSLDALIADAKQAETACDSAALPGMNERFSRIVPPRRFPRLREWLDIIAVVGAVAFGFRGLFIQTFKIPTSSMQPTLYGVHYMAEDGAANPLLAKLPMPLNALLFSARRAELTVTSGKYHQVRRMAAAAGNRVDALHRIAFGALRLPPGLECGRWMWLESERDIRGEEP